MQPHHYFEEPSQGQPSTWSKFENDLEDVQSITTLHTQSNLDYETQDYLKGPPAFNLEQLDGYVGESPSNSDQFILPPTLPSKTISTPDPSREFNPEDSSERSLAEESHDYRRRQETAKKDYLKNTMANIIKKVPKIMKMKKGGSESREKKFGLSRLGPDHKISFKKLMEHYESLLMNVSGCETLGKVFMREQRQHPEWFKVFSRVVKKVMRREYPIHALREGKMHHYLSYIQVKNQKLMNLFQHQCFSQEGRY